MTQLCNTSPLHYNWLLNTPRTLCSIFVVVCVPAAGTTSLLHPHHTHNILIIIMADSNIAGNNTAAAQTKQYLNDPMPYLTVTPFHCICNICSGSETKKKHSVTSISSQSVRLHYKKHHQDQFVLGNFNNISIRLAAAKLAATNGGWKEQLLKNDLSLVQTLKSTSFLPV